MNSRCTDPNNNRYKNYGARGIKVLWVTYREYERDMFSSWQEGLQIDRIDVNGDYSKENCRWVTAAQNAQNRTNSKLNLAQVAEIKKRFGAGAAYQESLAKEFGVSSRMIRYIGAGGAWR
jgi:hypothetical protein